MVGEREGVRDGSKARERRRGGGLEAAGDKGSRAAEAGGVRLVGQLLGALEQDRFVRQLVGG